MRSSKTNSRNCRTNLFVAIDLFFFFFFSIYWILSLYAFKYLCFASIEWYKSSTLMNFLLIIKLRNWLFPLFYNCFFQYYFGIQSVAFTCVCYVICLLANMIEEIKLLIDFEFVRKVFEWTFFYFSWDISNVIETSNENNPILYRFWFFSS